MGSSIDLVINTDCISQEQWEPLYIESLKFLDKFPLPLMRLDYQKMGRNHGRFSFVSDLVCLRGQEHEYWQMNGDALSGQYSEEALLFRSIRGRYWSRGNAEKDILWVHPKKPADSPGNGYPIFDRKTQGCPYHLAVQMIGMYFETRLPGKAYVYGDIDQGDCQEIQKWARTALNEELDMPIIFDGPKLWNRLTLAYDLEQQALKRFSTIYKGSRTDRRQTFASLSKELLIKNYRLELKNHEQIDLESLIVHMVQNLGNLYSALEISKQANRKMKPRKNRIDFTELLKSLCKDMITFCPEEKEILKTYRETLIKFRDTGGIKDEFINKILKIPNPINLFIPSYELLDAFAAHTLLQRTRFSNIIQASEIQHRRKLRKMLKEISTMNLHLSKYKLIPIKRPEAEDCCLSTMLFMDSKEFSIKFREFSREYAPEDKCILREAYRQKKYYDNPEKLTRELAPRLHEILESMEEKSRQECLNGIYTASEKNSLLLREASWAVIDAEKNLRALKYILALCRLQIEEKDSWEFRKHILEHKELWQYLYPGEKPAPLIGPS